MREFRAGWFMKIMAMLDNDIAVSAEIKAWDEHFIERLEAAKRVALDAGLFTSYATVSRLLDDLHRGPISVSAVRERVRNMRDVFKDEMTTFVYLELDAQSAQYYRSENPFGLMVAVNLNDAETDIEEAAKCLALDRGTACVFHLMRTLDFALQKFAAQLGVQVDVKNDWGTILSKLEAPIRSMPSSSKEEIVRKEEFQRAYAHLEAARTAWRNSTMHPRKHYSPSEAKQVFESVKIFTDQMVRLR